MLDHVVERLRPVATDIVVVGSTRAVGDIPADVSVAQDDVPFGGPLAGLAAGLRSLDPALERVLVVGGDMPTLVPAVLERLVSGSVGGRRRSWPTPTGRGPYLWPCAGPSHHRQRSASSKAGSGDYVRCSASSTSR